MALTPTHRVSLVAVEGIGSMRMKLVVCVNPGRRQHQKGQRKDPPELLNYLNAQAQLPRKDQETLGSNSAAALENHQATVGNPPTHLNA
jgi:hypothetical protein